MKISYAAALGLALTLIGCSTERIWLLAAPVSSDYPRGQANAPLAQWTRIRGYEDSEDCKSRLLDAQNRLQRPVLCVEVDNPQLKEN